MRLIKKMIHNDLKTLEGNMFERKAARGIILDNRKILLLYTKRYNDYSIPGGGIDEGEDIINALKRELSEEVGAKDIEILKEYGYTEEYRPHYKKEYDLMHMLSYIFVCKLNSPLEKPNFEDYEIANGMEVKWVDIDEAIKHNLDVISNKEKSMGFSVERETFVLQLIRDELLK